MTRLTVLGGTGYTGSAVVREAAARGHEVTAYSRTAPAEPVPGVTYVQASVLDSAVQQQIVAGADAVVSALAPRGDMAGTQVGLFTGLAALAAQSGTRLGVVGGFGSLRPAPGEPRFVGGLPEEYKPESLEMLEVKEALAAGPAQLDWFYVSPAMNFGSFNPGTATGSYRTSDEIALFDESGKSDISGSDFAKAIVDELEKPQYQRAHWSVAY